MFLRPGMPLCLTTLCLVLWCCFSTYAHVHAHHVILFDAWMPRFLRLRVDIRSLFQFEWSNHYVPIDLIWHEMLEITFLSHYHYAKKVHLKKYTSSVTIKFHVMDFTGMLKRWINKQILTLPVFSKFYFLSNGLETG